MAASMHSPPRQRVLPTLQFALVVCLAFGVAAAFARNEQVQAAWVEAYDNLEAAEGAEEDGDLTGALNLYRQARRQFLAVHRQAPQWNPSLVNYRIKYCLRKITALEKALRLQQSSRDRDQLVQTLERQADRIAELTRESENLEYKLQINAEALEKARTEAARHLMASHRVSQLVKENAAREQEVATLKQRVAQLERGGADDRPDRQVRRLQQEKAALEVKLGEAKAAAAGARRSATEEAGRVAALTDRLRLAGRENQALKRQVAELTDARAATRESEAEELRDLRQNLADAKQELQDATAALEDVRQRERDLTQALEAATKTAQERAESLAELRKVLAELKAQAPDEERAAATPEAETVAELRQQARQIPAMKAELVATKDALKKEEAETRELQERVNTLSASLAARDQAVRKQQQTIAELRAQLQGADTEASREAEDDAELTQLRAALTEERERARKLEKALHDALKQKDAAETAAEARPVPATTPPEQDAPEPEPVEHQENPAEREAREQARRERDARGFLEEGLRAEETGNTEAAVWNYQKAVDILPDNVVALHRLGLLAAEKGDDEQACEYLRRAARQNPEEADVLIPLGFALARREKPYEAVGVLAQAIAANPGDARPHRALGVAASSLGWQDIAEREMRAALDIDPNDSDSAFNLAILLASKDPPDMDEARRWYVKARELSGQSDPALDRLFNLDPL